MLSINGNSGNAGDTGFRRLNGKRPYIFGFIIGRGNVIIHSINRWRYERWKFKYVTERVNGDVSIWRENSGVGRKIPNKQILGVTLAA